MNIEHVRSLFRAIHADHVMRVAYTCYNGDIRERLIRIRAIRLRRIKCASTSQFFVRE